MFFGIVLLKWNNFFFFFLIDKIKVHLKLLEENLKNISSSLDSLAHDFAKGTRYDVDHNKLDVPAQQLDVTKTKNGIIAYLIFFIVFISYLKKKNMGDLNSFSSNF